jgi:hypothetical protein
MTEFETWVVNRYGGPNPINGIQKHLDYLLRMTNQNELPVSLATIANEIGINNVPIYDKLLTVGNLILINGVFRISINRPSGRPITLLTPNLGRYRFTYAHELVHALLCDLTSRPNQRIAPLPKTNEEETLCNNGARYLLIPPKILEMSINSESEFDARKVVYFARKAKVSIQVLLLQMGKENLFPNKKNSIYLLSRIGYRSDGKGYRKARCIIGVYYNSEGNRHQFLGINSGLDRIKTNIKVDKKWSLISFHEKINVGSHFVYKDIKNEEIILPNKSCAIFSGKYEQVQNSQYIWTTGSLVLKKEYELII